MFPLRAIFLETYSWNMVFGYLMHNLPVLILIGVLIISWKYEDVGGIIFILGGLLCIIALLTSPQLELGMLSAAMIISGPAFLIGFLFLKDEKS